MLTVDPTDFNCCNIPIRQLLTVSLLHMMCCMYRMHAPPSTTHEGSIPDPKNMSTDHHSCSVLARCARPDHSATCGTTRAIVIDRAKLPAFLLSSYQLA
jgi:hypothetical protein